MKKITITNVQFACEIGENKDPKLQRFEMEGPEEMEASDGYHTFKELYEHRITLFIALCRFYKYHLHSQKDLSDYNLVWRSKNILMANYLLAALGL